MACCADANIDLRGAYCELLRPLGVTILANPRIVDFLHHRWRSCRHKSHASCRFHAFPMPPPPPPAVNPTKCTRAVRIHHILYLSARALPSGRLAACGLHPRPCKAPFQDDPALSSALKKSVRTRFIDPRSGFPDLQQHSRIFRSPGTRNGHDSLDTRWSWTGHNIVT